MRRPSGLAKPTFRKVPIWKNMCLKINMSWNAHGKGNLGTLLRHEDPLFITITVLQRIQKGLRSQGQRREFEYPPRVKFIFLIGNPPLSVVP